MPITSVLVRKSARSGLRNVKITAATATRPAPAMASTDWTLNCEVLDSRGAAAATVAATERAPPQARQEQPSAGSG